LDLTAGRTLFGDFAAYREHGYLLTEIAACAGLHYSSISKIIKAWEEGKNSRFKT